MSGHTDLELPKAFDFGSPYAIKPIAVLRKTLKTYQSWKIIIMIGSSRSSELVYVHVRELLLTSHGVYDLRTIERTWFWSYTRHFWLRQKPTRHLQASQLRTCQLCEKQQSVHSVQSTSFELCEQLRTNQTVSFISLESSTSLVFRTFHGSSISILTKKLWLF